MENKLKKEWLDKFQVHLIEAERSRATVEKYLRDVRAFFAFMQEKLLEKTLVMAYKTRLLSTHAVSSVNSMLAALNVFLSFLGRRDLCVKQCKVQKSAYCTEEKELTKAEYFRLVQAAKRRGNERLSLLIQTICASGIRVSELPYITVAAVERGEAVVQCKGKNRRVFLVTPLKKKLLRYIREQKIKTGAVFVTRNGKPVSRHSVWRDMKSLCEQANVPSSKVFPHNLRHLFARAFYGVEKDIAKLADILGHTSINTTRVYIVTTGLEHRQKMERLHLLL